jgi:hypothetical protein
LLELIVHGDQPPVDREVDMTRIGQFLDLYRPFADVIPLAAHDLDRSRKS